MKKLFLLFFLAIGCSAQTTTTQGIDVTKFPGEDIGVQFANALAANGCNTYVIPARTTAYAFSHSMHVPRCVSLLGQGRGIQNGTTTEAPGTSFGTTLLWTGGAGAAIVSSDHTPGVPYDGGNYGPSGGTIGNFTLTATAITPNSIGIYAGGDPDGIISPATDWGQETRLMNIAIMNFDVAWKGGNNAFYINWSAPYIVSNNIGFTNDSRATDAGEEINIFGGVIAGNFKGAFYNTGFEYHLFGTSIDFNGGPDYGYQITNASVMLENCHVESHHELFYSGSFLWMHGGSIQFDDPGSNAAQLIAMSSNVANSLDLVGVNVYSNSTIGSLVNWTNGSDPFPHLWIAELVGNHNGAVQSIINKVPPAWFKDVKIDTCLGPTCLVVSNR